MFYSPLLNKAASKLTTYGALQYVYQDPNGGEFVGCDKMVMLIENNGTPFMAKFWDTITQMPIDCTEEYPDWKRVLNYGKENAKKIWWADKVLLQGGYAIFNGLYARAKYYQLVKDFIGSEMVINISEYNNVPIYFYNKDKSRQAFIMPFTSLPKKLDTAEWNVIDNCGTIIYTTKDLEEAELFGLTVKMVGDK